MPAPEEFGEIKVSNEVISTIVRKAAEEVEGVRGIGGRFSFNEVFGKKDPEKGITINTEEGRCEITIEVKLEYGIPIYELARKLQKNVKEAVEHLTGFIVPAVNVVISGLAVSEWEMREKGKQKYREVVEMKDEETI